ncbi:sugar transferase [Eubacterium limosum]|uniref:sugar transferase n=1 Tax=Eubacterium limosum TaxID=1736 RepID=UPI0022DF6520|nr:sugar transferase [Eubacterium limosum]
MYRYFIKRLLDILVSLLILPVFIIFFIPVAFFIKFDDGGPIFYNANRLGKGMKEFKMYKFRSMKVNAEDIRNKDGSTYNSENDPRVTKVGKFIRKTSIDEVPQILNVLKGDMSIVGPRPSPLGNKDIYPKKYLKKFEIRPGITGYNQAILRNSSSMEQRVENDLYYLNHISFLLDLKIVVLTIVIVLKKKNINQKK